MYIKWSSWTKQCRELRSIAENSKAGNGPSAEFLWWRAMKKEMKRGQRKEKRQEEVGKKFSERAYQTKKYRKFSRSLKRRAHERPASSQMKEEGEWAAGLLHERSTCLQPATPSPPPQKAQSRGQVRGLRQRAQPGRLPRGGHWLGERGLEYMKGMHSASVIRLIRENSLAF